jgi:hypothetical protein
MEDSIASPEIMQARIWDRRFTATWQNIVFFHEICTVQRFSELMKFEAELSGESYKLVHGVFKQIRGPRYPMYFESYQSQTKSDLLS